MGPTIMAKIISLRAVRENRADETEAAKVNWKMGIDQAATLGKSPSYRKSHLCKSVNPYREIYELKRKVKLLKQGIGILAQENRRLKGQ